MQYDGSRWIKHFKFMRMFVRQLIEKLKLLMQKKDATYCYAILVTIRIACSLYKLVHKIEYLHCNELCIVGKPNVHLVLHEFVWFMNQMLQNQIAWLKRDDLSKVMNGFRELCKLLAIHGFIDVTQIHMFKPKGQHVTKYFSYKSKAYNMQFLVVIDYQKKFRNAFVGMWGSMNDARVL